VDQNHQQHGAPGPQVRPGHQNAQRQAFAEAAPEALMQDREFGYRIAEEGKQAQRRSESKWMAGPENPSTGGECNPPAGTP
jgi:hypothetical protein